MPAQADHHDPVLGRSLFLSGQAAEAGPVLQDITAQVAPDRQPLVTVNAFALLSLIAGADGDSDRALALSRQAMEVATAWGIEYDTMTGVAYIALARATARQGGLAEAERLLDQALGLLRVDSYKLQYGLALLELADVRSARGDIAGAQAAVERARRLIATFTDPGMLGAQLGRIERVLGRARRQPSTLAALTDRELVVLRMLPTALSQPEIARELTVSVNTVRTQLQAIYRKLGVASRQEAIAVARDRGLLP